MNGRIKESLWLYSMRKRFQITSMFDDIDKANEYMEKHDSEAVIAVAAGIIFLADKHQNVPA